MVLTAPCSRLQPSARPGGRLPIRARDSVLELRSGRDFPAPKTAGNCLLVPPRPCQALDVVGGLLRDGGCVREGSPAGMDAGGPAGGRGCVSALWGGVSADAQAYFGTRPGLAPGRRHDVRWGVPAEVAAAHSFWAVPTLGWVGSSLARSWPRFHRLISGLPRDSGQATGAIAWSPRSLRMW
jgi:hypothetical protein